MIIKASHRGGAKQLGLHLLKTENEHVTVHEMRGFVSDDLIGAMKESYAISHGTKCQTHLFSVSFNPPSDVDVSDEMFEDAANRLEKSCGLTGQPRALVFHEKEGRRHMHAVWSRIDADTMKARELGLYKYKARELSKELYLEHNWKMPRGLVDAREADPRNFTLEEWQECKRMGKNARDVKGQVQDCWAISDNRAAFEAALSENGMWLAKGDRRSYVAVTHEGETISLSRYIGKKSKELEAKLGSSEALRSVDETKAHIAKEMSPTFERLISEAKDKGEEARAAIDTKRLEMVEGQRIERQKLTHEQQVRSQREVQERSDRFNKGLRGLWDRLTGRHRRIIEENAVSVREAEARDKREREHQIRKQMDERRNLQTDIQAVRDCEKQILADLYRDRERLTASKDFEIVHSLQAPGQTRLDAFKEMRRRQSEERGASREVGRNTAQGGPEMER
ncbi:relaxase/mobilization nuclease domain-containing protein [Ponticaulis sp.]|uniref:relaxase/mobilization nuclease domain-containing protein n=1 Tax=Ponticaulis sp. TaxID=2020902 RepID=UPI000B768ED3|nr:relaxase/mobilization nuclease domain-containing protein [Ponticaulis sp.]MAJ09239.1 relaxase [Ponticaulis sp.]HBJ91323.1 relaxase [Hyphomonadaceae bacterium]|tara:strand:+ start:22746 stop:24101 length:1356 start_codon:yes stop_codon:yes gene_type:complete